MKNNIKFFLAIFLTFVFFLSPHLPVAWADFHLEDIRIDTDLLAHSSTVPQIAGDDRGNVYVVWIDDRPDVPEVNIYFNKSNDFGLTWLEQDIALDSTGGLLENSQLKIACDHAGHVYIIWIKGQSSQDIMAKVSNNDGETWQTHQLDVGGLGWQSNSIVNVDFDHTANGNICAVWDGAGNDDEIYINCSSDHGQTWMTAYRQVNSDVPYPYDIHRDPQVAVDTSGRVYVIWLDNRGASGGEMFVYANRSFDLGQTWPQDIGFHGSVNGVVASKPRVECDEQGNVFAAWQQSSWPSSHRCFFNRSLNFGNHWTGIQPISYYAKSPQIKTDGEGLVFYAYLDVQQSQYQKLRWMRSLDKGETWQSSVQISNTHDVQADHFDLAFSGQNIYMVWENNEPWQGIYFNFSANKGATWHTQDIRVDHHPGDMIPTARPSIAVGRQFVYVAWEDEREEALDIYFNKGKFSDHQKIHREAQYILSCQFLDPENPAHGAINNIFGSEPTWVVPRENALAILGLIEASGGIQQSSDHYFVDRANTAMDYLVRVQDRQDGAWHDQYSYEQPVIFSKSPTQTAETMMAMFALGYRPDRYKSMYLGAQYLLLCQQHGFGGLLCGGKQEDGSFSQLHWASDNSFAFLALKSARTWALRYGDVSFAQQCEQAAENILDGIDQHLYNKPQWEAARWHQAIDQNGNPANPSNNDWINYAPYMLDLPVSGIDPQALGQWIRDTFQKENGGCIGPNTDRQYPGLSFQASLCWLDAGQNHFAQKAIGWSEMSGLWQTLPDPNGVAGGWIDWVSVSNPQNTASWWERFIDTSFYAIAAWQGGCDFTVFFKEPEKLRRTKKHSKAVR